MENTINLPIDHLRSLTHITEPLLSHINSNPMKLTYIGIGAANNKSQQLPQYLLKYCNHFNFRIIIIDPLINNIPDILNNNLYLYEKINHFVSDNLIINFFKIYPHNNNNFIEFITIKAYADIDYNNFNNNEHFYVKLINIILQQNNILLLTDYTGCNSITLHNILFSKVSPELKQQFNDSILLDTTYGRDLGCNFDLNNEFNHPIITFNNNHLKIYNLVSLPLNHYQQYINQSICALYGTEYEHKFKHHQMQSIKYHIDHFKNNNFVNFRKIINFIQENNLSFDDISNPYIQQYLILEINIIEMFNIFYNIYNEFLDQLQLQNNMRTGNRYKCFDNIIFNIMKFNKENYF